MEDFGRAETKVKPGKTWEMYRYSPGAFDLLSPSSRLSVVPLPQHSHVFEADQYVFGLAQAKQLGI